MNVESLLRAIDVSNRCTLILQLDRVWSSKSEQASDLSPTELAAVAGIGHRLRINIEQLMLDEYFLTEAFPGMVRDDAAAGLFGSPEANDDATHEAQILAREATALIAGANGELWEMWYKVRDVEDLAKGKEGDPPEGDISGSWKRRLQRVAASMIYLTFRYYTGDGLPDISGVDDFIINYGPIIYKHAGGEVQEIVRRIQGDDGSTKGSSEQGQEEGRPGEIAGPGQGDQDQRTGKVDEGTKQDGRGQEPPER
ncbi:hypothetical protein ACWCPI_28980 [Streptomyces sp. NPDC001920]